MLSIFRRSKSKAKNANRSANRRANLSANRRANLSAKSNAKSNAKNANRSANRRGNRSAEQSESELILSDDSQEFWKRLKRRDNIHHGFKTTKYGGNDFMDYVDEFNKKNCKFFVSFDGNEEGTFLSELFQYILKDGSISQVRRSFEERYEIIRFLFEGNEDINNIHPAIMPKRKDEPKKKEDPEKKKEPKIYYNSHDNILFFKRRHLIIFTQILNKHKYYDTDIGVLEMLEKPSLIGSNKDRILVKFLYGTTRACDLKKGNRPLEDDNLLEDDLRGYIERDIESAFAVYKLLNDIYPEYLDALGEK
jgi:hypothetical protein